MQPNAPGTQGYNRYAYAANNPARWTDPSGHSVSDAGALQAPIRVFVEQMQTLGAVTLALLPVMLALGPLGGMIGLVIAIQFLQLAMLIFMVVAQMLEVIQDDFTYYADGSAPVEWAKEWTAENLPDAPDVFPLEDCYLLSEEILSALIQQLAINGTAIIDAIMSMFGQCLDGMQKLGMCFVGCVSDHSPLRNLLGLVSGVLAACGLNVLDRNAKKTGGGASKGTSVCSKYLRQWVKYDLPKPVRAPTIARPGSKTTDLGAVFGRWIPIAGAAGVLAETSLILYCTGTCATRCET